MVTSEAELQRALRGDARHSHRRSSRRLANFFFVLFLFGKEKGHLQPRIYRFVAEKINAVAEDIFSKGFDNSFFMCYNKRSIRFHLSDSRNEAE